MNRWNGKVAIVTGASSGIGVAVAESFVKHGIKVAGLARRLDRLKELSAKLGPSKFFPIQCDLRSEADILKAFARVEKELGGADILVNNAGLLILKPIMESPTEDYRNVIDTNVMALTICSREAIKSMTKRNVAGHIININSITGHCAECIKLPFGIYSASKYAVTALGSGFRVELLLMKSGIKISSVSPGAVETDMVRTLLPPGNIMPVLQPEDIAEAVVYVLGTPKHVEVRELTITPQGVPITASPPPK